MSTDELDPKQQKKLEAKIRKRLNDSGWRRVGAPQRDHPFHSALLRNRVDEAAKAVDATFDASLFDPAGREEFTAVWQESERPRDDEGVARWVESLVERYRRAWSKAFEWYRDVRKNPNYWRNSFMLEWFYPPKGPPLPDGPPPPPVYIRRPTDMVISLRDGAVDLWVKA